VGWLGSNGDVLTLCPLHGQARSHCPTVCHCLWLWMGDAFVFLLQAMRSSPSTFAAPALATASSRVGWGGRGGERLRMDWWDGSAQLGVCGPCLVSTRDRGAGTCCCLGARLFFRSLKSAILMWFVVWWGRGWILGPSALKGGSGFVWTAGSPSRAFIQTRMCCQLSIAITRSPWARSWLTAPRQGGGKANLFPPARAHARVLVSPPWLTKVARLLLLLRLAGAWSAYH
jgi:hypothetical protein